MLNSSRLISSGEPAHTKTAKPKQKQIEPYEHHDQAYLNNPPVGLFLLGRVGWLWLLVVLDALLLFWQAYLCNMKKALQNAKSRKNSYRSQNYYQNLTRSV